MSLFTDRYYSRLGGVKRPISRMYQVLFEGRDGRNANRTELHAFLGGQCVVANFTINRRVTESYSYVVSNGIIIRATVKRGFIHVALAANLRFINVMLIEGGHATDCCVQPSSERDVRCDVVTPLRSIRWTHRCE